MSVSVAVHLLSGKSASLEAEADASIESLKDRAQSALGTGRGRLLDGAQTVKEGKLKSGDVLTLHVNQVQIKATRPNGASSAFTALLRDGSVVTWGHADCGGDSGAVLQDVKQIQASLQAFAAILGDGSVVTWGDADCGCICCNPG